MLNRGFEMIKVLCIIDGLAAGGAETFLMKMFRSLPREKYMFDFIVSAAGGCYEDEVKSLGGKIYVIPKRTENIFAVVSGIYSIVKNNKYKYVLKLGSRSIAVVDLIVAKLAGAKCLAIRSCNAPTGLSVKERVLHKTLQPLLNIVSNVKIAPSMLAAEFTFGKRCAKKNVYLLNNGVDLNVYHYDPKGREDVRKEFGIQNELLIGHVGRFHRQKNHKYLLKVFYEIKKLHQGAVLMLVGIGELEEEIRSLAKELNLESSVIFTGLRFDVPQLLSAMDVFVFPSLHEGMPNTVIEAQATGLPCIIADTITREANITELVQYHSLSQSAFEWAKAVLESSEPLRKNTADDFRKHGYDIEGVSKSFISMLGIADDFAN